jgi:hypothetical protein
VSSSHAWLFNNSREGNPFSHAGGAGGKPGDDPVELRGGGESCAPDGRAKQGTQNGGVACPALRDGRGALDAQDVSLKPL